MTPEALHACMPYASVANCAKFAQPITDAMVEFGIDTSRRMAYFLAQIAHESGSLQYVKELSSGSAYEGRKDLGNTQAGDGVLFKGRGLIQITGRNNYKLCGDALGLPLLSDPQSLEQTIPASRSAGWFWKSHNLNGSADDDDIRVNTRIINGGFNGLNERIKRLAEAKHGLGIA